VKKQRGVLIVALMAGIAIVMILSTVAFQQWADIARRDAEAEMIFRAQDITRALKRFQVDRGRLPIEMKELLEVGAHRPQYFIRQMWKDPLVKGGKWQLIYASPSGGVFDPTVPVATPGAAPGASTSPFSTGLLDKDGNQPGQPLSGGSPTDPGAQPGIGKNKDGTPDVTGLPIAGVKSLCKDRPFRRYREKELYSEWVFSIFDLEPRQPAISQPGQGGQPGQPGVPGMKNGKADGGAVPSFPPK
jgi:type II secretory pathway pseudopilin PulG